MNNSIDRQLAIDTAIDAVDSWDGGCNKEREKIVREALEKLPSVEQRHIRCVDCKHWINHHLCESLSRYGTFETKAEFFCGYAERKVDE